MRVGQVQHAWSAECSGVDDAATDWRIKPSPAVVSTGQRGATPKRVRLIELASEVDAEAAREAHGAADGGNTTGGTAAAAAATRLPEKSKQRRSPKKSSAANADTTARPSRVDGVIRARRHDGGGATPAAAAAAAAAAAFAAAGDGGEKLIASKLRSAKMRLREGQTPWSNTPKSKLRELQLAVTVWQRLASAVRLPWFVGDRCDATGAGYPGLSGTIAWLGPAAACGGSGGGSGNSSGGGGGGIVAGVVLDEPRGAHDGEVSGRRFFRCSHGCGVMVQAAALRPLRATATATATANTAAGASPSPTSVQATAAAKTREVVEAAAEDAVGAGAEIGEKLAMEKRSAARPVLSLLASTSTASAAGAGIVGSSEVVSAGAG